MHLSGAIEQIGIHKNEKCVQHRSNYLLGLCDTSLHNVFLFILSFH